MDTIIESLKEFFENSDLIDKKINVDFLPEELLEYSIMPIPTKPIIKSYLDGSCKKQYDFIFCSREYYGDDVKQLLSNIEFYENLAKWIESKSRNGELPKLPKGCEPLKLKIVNSGYLYDDEKDNAQYHIECKLIYMERKEN